MNATLTYFTRQGKCFGQSEWESSATDLSELVKEVEELRRTAKLPGKPGWYNCYVVVKAEGRPPRLII